MSLQQHLQGSRSPPGSPAHPAADMVAEMNALGSRYEDLVDENRLLRSKAGLQDDEAVDLSDVKLIKVTVRTRQKSCAPERDMTSLLSGCPAACRGCSLSKCLQHAQQLHCQLQAGTVLRSPSPAAGDQDCTAARHNQRPGAGGCADGGGAQEAQVSRNQPVTPNFWQWPFAGCRGTVHLQPPALAALPPCGANTAACLAV